MWGIGTPDQASGKRQVIFLMEQWKLFRILPNVEVVHAFETLSDHVAVVSYDDDRALAIRSQSKSALKLWEGFRDIYGNAQRPSGLIFVDGFEQVKNAQEAIVAFRNIVAMSSILPSWAELRTQPGSTPTGPLWSDAWALYPVEVSANDTLLTVNPALLVGSSPDAPFVGMPNPLISVYGDRFQVDWPLFALLLQAWDNQYIRSRRPAWYYEALFRALEIAMHALAVPVQNLSSVHDFGLSLAIWVSAFEVLIHPGRGGKVDETRVLQFLASASSRWDNPKLRHKRYVVTVGGKIERVYHQLYSARNTHLHGNAILKRHWSYVGRRGSIAVGNLAPLVFRTALKLRLGWELSRSISRVIGSGLDPTTYATVMEWCDARYEDALVGSM